MRQWKRNFDFNEDQLLSFKEGVAIIVTGVLLGGGIVGGWMCLIQWFRP